MPSQSTGIYILLSGVLAAIISGIFSVWNNEKQRIWQLEREEQEHIRQLEREEEQRIWQLEREKQQGIWQDESDQKKWYREKIYDSYRRSIEILTQMIQEDSEIRLYDDMGNAEKITLSKRMNILKLTSAFFAELNIIRADHPDKDSKEFKDKINEIEEIYTNNNKFIETQVIITKMIENDSRIKNVIK